MERDDPRKIVQNIVFGSKNTVWRDEMLFVSYLLSFFLV